MNKITVDNVGHKEIVHHSFLLLKTTIRHDDCNAQNDRDLNVSVENNSTTTHFKSTGLKCLVELKPGENRILLKYCCVYADVTVTYSRRQSKFQLVPIYIINDGHDGRFQAPESETNTIESACERIVSGCKLLQCFVAEKLNDEGFGRKTFQIDSGECRVFTSKLRREDTFKMAQDELWSHLGREIMQSDLAGASKKYLGFLSCTKYRGSVSSERVLTHEDVVSLTDGYVALGGGGLALFGSACLYAWPEDVSQVVDRFEDRGLIDKARFMDDSCYRGTLGACFSTTLGSVLHELCHTFDLGHTEQGIMGRGFDNINKFFVSSPNNLIGPDRRPPPQLQPPKCSAVTIKIGEKINKGFIRNPIGRNEILRKTKGEDETYFTKSCSALLCYHRFFNDYINDGQNVLFTFDGATKLLKSTAGIRVVELREEGHEMVIGQWIFPGKVLKFSFRIPDDYVKNDCILVAEDNAGNILKQNCAK